MWYKIHNNIEIAGVAAMDQGGCLAAHQHGQHEGGEKQDDAS